MDEISHPAFGPSQGVRKMLKVYPAEPYRSGELLSFGKARYMLLSQFNFPLTYKEDEALWSRDSDRLEEANAKRVASCLRTFRCGFDSFHSAVPFQFEEWVRKQHHDHLLAFVSRVLGAATDHTEWTGYRIAGTVHDNGHAIYHFQLFARDPNGTTEVYTGEPAPNVLSGPRPR